MVRWSTSVKKKASNQNRITGEPMTPTVVKTPTLVVDAAPTREELAKACEGIATRTNILDLFITELSRCGFVGEERASRLIYLALVSRLLNDPVSIAVKGP